ncbi:RHS repeat-associated core domain-containing protein [Luteolibacter pohnpeiensis]|uniref:RHS repeat-associated core domain-containing protein n=1 Tax=Luteolibacter pohnpeiensis TaxID=454153 RepID=A0A934S5I1_9BACT|nr:RHS repeat-associated core domain-containing protein [Luteolibacter pohnpeiensis]MBK1882238.1 RHS repeat-associated core domain-containing protein [Luteolibacter pohnpeiensis]
MLYLYEGWNPVAIGTRTGTASSMGTMSLKWTNLWGPDIGSFGKVSGSADFQAPGGVGGLLASSYYNSSTTTPDNHFVPSYDANGNILAWTSQTGALARQNDYDPFGNVVMKRSLLSGVPDFGFSTKLQDTESGLLYFGYRFYDPITGRWPSRDPIEEDGGINLYGFVGNDGMNRWDLLGLKIEAPEQAKELLNKAKNLDPGLKKMIEDLENSPHVIKIICVESVKKVQEITGGNARMSPDAGNIKDYEKSMEGGPGQGSMIELYCGCNGDEYPQEEFYRSSLTVLVHELQHSWDMAMAKAALKKNKRGNAEYYTNPGDSVQESEQRAVRTENIVRDWLNKDIRTTYGGDPVTNPQGNFSPVYIPPSK